MEEMTPATDTLVTGVRGITRLGGHIKMTKRGDHKKTTEDLPAILGEAFTTFPLAKEFYKYFLVPVLRKRNAKWFSSVYEKLKMQQERAEGQKIEELINNEAFMSTLMQASQSAIRSHQNEKLEALRNAVLNSALPTSPEENKQAIFLSLIDEFTPLHLKMLIVYASIKEDEHRVRRDELVDIYLRETFADFEENRPMYVQILDILESRGLIKKQVFGANPDVAEYYFPAYATPMGIEFLDFISSPLEDERSVQD